MAETWFEEEARFVADVTKMLNTIVFEMYKRPNLNYHLHVELHENETFRKVGEWSDEISADAWYFQETPEAKDAEVQKPT